MILESAARVSPVNPRKPSCRMNGMGNIPNNVELSEWTVAWCTEHLMARAPVIPCLCDRGMQWEVRGVVRIPKSNMSSCVHYGVFVGSTYSLCDYNDVCLWMIRYNRIDKKGMEMHDWAEDAREYCQGNAHGMCDECPLWLWFDVFMSEEVTAGECVEWWMAVFGYWDIIVLVMCVTYCTTMSAVWSCFMGVSEHCALIVGTWC